MRRITSLMMALMLLAMSSMAQVRNITGKVMESNGSPAPYVNVTVKGTKNAVVANDNGAFTIKAKTGDVLVITGVGLQTQEVKVTDGELPAISIARLNNNLSEVVVTALGIKRSKNSVPYATQQISGDDLNKVPNPNVLNNLSGKIAGLQVNAQNTLGGSTNVILRGLKSLTQSNQALFVIDGVPYDNTNQSRSGYDLGNVASDINPDDIESVNVLKGAAASALYGSRASNGVILINTKKASHRGKGLGVSVNFGVQVGSPDKSTLPVYQTNYGQGYGSAGNDPGGPNIPGFFYYTPTITSTSPVKVVQTDVDAGTGPAYDPSIMVYNWDAFSPGNPNYGKATPWMPAAHNKPTDFFVTPVTTMTSVAIDNTSDKGTFKLIYTNTSDKGLFPNSNILKNQVNFASTYNLTNKLTVGGAFNFLAESALNRNLYAYTGTTNIMTDFRQWWPTNVDINALKDDYFRTKTNATWNWLGGYTTNTIGSISKPAYHNNPYWQLYKNYQTDSRFRYFGNVNANYKFNEHFNLMGRVSIDSWDQQVELRTDVGSVETSSYSRVNTHFAETNYDLLLNYNQTFGKFAVRALLGGNVRQQVNSGISSASNGGLVVPSYFALANSKNTPLAPGESYSMKEVDGVFGGATLTYNDFLTLDATLRRDQSSTLPSSNNKYYYPSVSGNFIFSKLLSGLSWLSYGKLRLNYAQVGGDAPVYSLANTYAAGTPFNSQTVFSSATTNNNPNLVPEENHSYEAGIEASFLKNRVGFDVTFYNAEQINQILPVTVSRASGFNTFFVNGGSVRNRGVEVSINLVPIKMKDFTWSMNINWSKNKSTVLSLYNGQPSYTVASYQNAIQLVAKVGDSYGVLRGTDYQYSASGQRLIDNNGYYMLASNKLSDIGNINPDWLGGISNTFSYKNIALSFLVDIRQGGQLYSLDMDYGSSSGLYPENAGGLNDLGKPARAPLSQGGGIILNGVNATTGKPNTVRIDESDINTGNYTFSSSYGEADKSYVYDASYIKLRELALTYSLPQNLVSKLKIFKGIDVAVTGRNLWIIHKNLPYADPEQGQASGNASVGFQNGAYPSLKTYGCNIKLKF